MSLDKFQSRALQRTCTNTEKAQRCFHPDCCRATIIEFQLRITLGLCEHHSTDERGHIRQLYDQSVKWLDFRDHESSSFYKNDDERMAYNQHYDLLYDLDRGILNSLASDLYYDMIDDEDVKGPLPGIIRTCKSNFAGTESCFSAPDDYGFNPETVVGYLDTVSLRYTIGCDAAYITIPDVTSKKEGIRANLYDHLMSPPPRTALLYSLYIGLHRKLNNMKRYEKSLPRKDMHTMINQFMRKLDNIETHPSSAWPILLPIITDEIVRYEKTLPEQYYLS